MTTRKLQFGIGSNGITEGVIWKQILLYFFPILLGTFFQQMYNTVDAVIVGQFVGKEALAAVGGATGQIINLIVGFFVGLSSGGTVIISQFYGMRNADGVSRAVHTAIALALIIGVFLAVVGILIAPAALRMMRTPEDIIPGAEAYLRIFFAGITTSLLYNIGSGILRAIGDSRRPLYYLIVCTLANIVLDLFFVAVLKLGVAGVAIATVLAQAISAVLVILTLARAKDSYQLRLRKLRIDLSLLKNILRIGLPAGVQSSMFAISNTLIQSTVNTFGTDTVAAWTAYSKLDAFFWMITGAFGISVTTFVGQNLGAGKLDRVRRSVRVVFLMNAVAAVTMSLVMFFAGTNLLRIFTSDAEVLRLGTFLIRRMVPFYITWISVEIFSGAMRGGGEALGPMLLTIFGICVLRIIWIFTYLPSHNTLGTLAFSYPLSWVITSALYWLYYFKSGWLKRRSAHISPVRTVSGVPREN